MALYIPDVSHYDPVLSWPAVKENVYFLITKATEGTSYIDPTLSDFIQKCEKYKIPYWLYTFLKKGNELAQAKFMVSTCKNMVGKYFIGYVLDVERNNELDDVVDALAWLNKQGTKTMLYTQYSQCDMYKVAIRTRGADCAWWEARYGKNTKKYNPAYPPHQGVDLHQFTENGSINGIPTLVDLNRICETEKDLKWFTTPKSNLVTQTVQTIVNKVKKKGYTGTYPVFSSERNYYKRGDGITTLRNYPTQIKRVQALLNWIDDTTKDLKEDGEFGKLTEQKVIVAQGILKVPQTGKFDKSTLDAAKKYKKE